MDLQKQFALQSVVTLFEGEMKFVTRRKDA